MPVDTIDRISKREERLAKVLAADGEIKPERRRRVRKRLKRAQRKRRRLAVEVERNKAATPDAEGDAAS